MGVMENSFNKGVNYFLKTEPFSNMTSSGRGHLHNHVWLNIGITLAEKFSLLIISFWYLREVKARDFKKIEPAYGRIKNCQVGDAHILIGDHFACMMLSYCIGVWTYHVDIKKFHIFNVGIILGGSCP